MKINIKRRERWLHFEKGKKKKLLKWQQVLQLLTIIAETNMVKKGYHVIATPKEGLENIHLTSVRSLSTEDSDVLGIGYLGVEIKYPCRQDNIRKQTQETKKKSNLKEQVIDFVPTQAFQLIRTEYSQLSKGTSESSLEYDSQTEPSFSHVGSVQQTSSDHCQVYPVQLVLPKKAINPLHWFQLDSSCSDCVSLGSVSFDADWSESSEEDGCISEFNSSNCSEKEGRLSDFDNNKVEEGPESRFVDMDDAAVHYGCPKVQNITNPNTLGQAIEKGRRTITKVQTLTDLNNENHYVKREKTESLNSILSNVFDNVLEGRNSYKENNVMSSGTDFSNGMSERNLSNLKQIRCTKRTNSDETILDMQKYVIQKENIYNKNNYNIKSWNVKCFDCKTVQASSKLDSSDSSPESVIPYPLDGMYKKRQNVTKRTNYNVLSVSSILCGCVNRKAKSAKKFQKTTKNFGGRFPPVGFRMSK